MENKDIFARELHEKRKERGWTQEETAIRCLVSVRHYHNLESGKSAPRLNVAVAAARELDFSLDKLFLPGRELVIPSQSQGQRTDPDQHSRPL